MNFVSNPGSEWLTNEWPVCDGDAAHSKYLAGTADFSYQLESQQPANNGYHLAIWQRRVHSQWFILMKLGFIVPKILMHHKLWTVSLSVRSLPADGFTQTVSKGSRK